MRTYTEIDGNKFGTPLRKNSQIDMDEYMSVHHKEYITYSSIQIMCITFNVNTRSPRGNVINLFLPPNNYNPPHIYAISLQEMDLGTEALLRTSGITNREQEWLNIISRYLDTGYVRTSRQRLLGIALFVYTAKHCATHVRLLGEQYLATGLMGIIGNKGGVAATLLYKNTTISFVGSHFPAHDDNITERNQNFRDISRVCVVPSDIVFWLGDLNYRLNNLSNEYVRQLIKSNELDLLLAYDQLRSQRELGQIFVEYYEPPISFPPTYKFDTGTDNYDTSSKYRIPAWTDRILYSHSINNPVEYLHYDSVPEIRFSDHRPVRAIYSVHVGSIDRSKETGLRHQFYAESNRIQSRMQPKAVLSNNELNFGEVYFMEIAEKTVEISNVGTSELRFEIVNAIDSEGRGTLNNSWMSVEPHTHTLQPNTSIIVHFSIHITVRELDKFNCGENISDTLVVRVVNGSHYFVSIEGSFRPTSFGRSLNMLCNTTKPISQLGQPLSDQEELPIPKELYYLIDCLVRQYVHGNVNYFVEGDPYTTELSHIARCIDGYCSCCTPSSLDATPGALFLSILLFVGSLAKPLIPSTYIPYCIDCSTPALAAEIVDLLPFLHRRNLIYLMSFFRYISRHADYDIKYILSTKIESALFQIGDYQSVQTADRTLFILSFLTMEDSTFIKVCSSVNEF